jgi:phosphoglycolate phosphatase-like HAD superfamily hydrolase
MIGDTYRDKKKKKNAGVKGILVKTGYGREALRDINSDGLDKPDFVAEDILEAVNWIMKDRIK